MTEKYVLIAYRDSSAVEITHNYYVFWNNSIGHWTFQNSEECHFDQPYPIAKINGFKAPHGWREKITKIVWIPVSQLDAKINEIFDLEFANAQKLAAKEKLNFQVGELAKLT